MSIDHGRNAAKFRADLYNVTQALGMASPGPWDRDFVSNDGCDFTKAVDPDGHALFDTLNSDVACIETEIHDDGSTRWDSQGQADVVAAISAVNFLREHADRIRALALAQPAEPDDIAESAKKIVSELPRYFHEVRGSYVHWGVFPAKHKDGEWVKWSDVESGAFIEALIRLQSTPTANTAQPAEAVEGDATGNDLVSIGGRMANLCWNVASAYKPGSGEFAFPEDYRKSADQLRIEWDRARKNRTPTDAAQGAERGPDRLYYSKTLGRYVGMSFGMSGEGAQGDGVGLIAAERRRQVEAEGWTPEHDDEHGNDSLAFAAAAYSIPESHRGDPAYPRFWPWELRWWKPSPDNRVRELTKAGALIAAEIDRLQRAAAPSPEPRS